MCGYDSGSAVFWTKVNNAWPQKKLYDATGQEVSGGALLINDRCEIVCWSDGAGYGIVRNAVFHLFTELCPDYDTSGYPIAINNKGAILTSKQLLIPVSLMPDNGVAGVVGDMVPSNQGENGEWHFVSPKKSTAIPDDYVTIKLEGPTQWQFDQFLKWDGGEAVPNEPFKRRVKRDATGKTTLKILRKSDNHDVAKLNVWVVWCDCTKVGDHEFRSYGEFIQNEDGSNGTATMFEGGYNFKFSIHPSSLITENDRPDLEGQNEFEGSEISPPGSGMRHFLNNLDLEGGVNKKWDVSRRIRVKVLNPEGYHRDDLPDIDGTLWDNQPVTPDFPVSYPVDDCIGNDDPTYEYDEDNNPYIISSSLYREHAISEIASFDIPRFAMRDSTGVDGGLFEYRLHFGEFARLLIGRKWYKCSDFFDWRIHFRIQRASGKWENAGSSMATDNNGF